MMGDRVETVVKMCTGVDTVLTTGVLEHVYTHRPRMDMTTRPVRREANAMKTRNPLAFLSGPSTKSEARSLKEE